VSFHPVQRAARLVLRMLGWSLDVALPAQPRGVVIVYPHTSNWDFVVGYLAKLAAGLPLQWIGKDSLFRWPFGALLRRMGGIPVRRGARAGFIDELAREYAARERLWIAIAPEGTRAWTDHWKSGFYHLALAARLPVGLACIDWGRRRIELRCTLDLSGDPEVDLERIRAFYRGVRGRRPERAGEIRFAGAGRPVPEYRPPSAPQG
jgi:1-acyl-sn-glycerol-3-phosphate acyltransferase